MAGCGRKGPPLPPLRPVPGAVGGLTARRVGARIELRFTLPAANQDGTKPVALERVDVYARSTPAGSPQPTNEQVIDHQNLVGSISVRPPEPDDAPEPEPGAPVDDRPAAGESAQFVDRIPSEAPKPLPLPKRPSRPLPPPPIDRLAPVKPPPPPAPATRYFMLVAASPKNRTSRPAVIAVPLTDPPPAPSNAHLAYDATTLTMTWTPGEEDQVFRVYDADASGRETGAGPLNPSPLTSPTFTAPVAFGKERCLAVRGVVIKGAVAIETDAASACATPTDTFPPPAPTALTAFADAGVIALTWDPVRAADLRGYLVLRAEGAGDRLLQLTPDPIVLTSYRDTSVTAGTTYTYTVVAVDQATPPNRSPNSATVTRVAR